MKIKTNIIILILLSFLSCRNQESKITSLEEFKKEEENKLWNNQDIKNPGEYFAKGILEIYLGKKSFNLTESENLDYNQLFSNEGIVNIVAYYDKRTNQPNKFEDFLLFVASYDNPNNARSAFERIKLDAELSNSKENINQDQEHSNRTELLKLGDKYGGLITYNGNKVFSLVENCDKIPLGNSWLDLEYSFTDLLKNENGYVEVLNAGCEEGRYYEGKREASS